MLAFSSCSRCLIPLLLLLLLLLPGQLATYPSSLEPGSVQIKFIRDVVEKVHKERPVETVLVMKRRQDNKCLLNDVNPIELPTLRLSGETNIKVIEIFNNQVLALVCISEFADSMLLTALAQRINRMRESRILVLLQSEKSNLMEFLRIITESAHNYNYVHLVVLYFSDNITEPIHGYRLEPFPSPTIEAVNLNVGRIFPRIYHDFKGKTSYFLPDLFPPRSILGRDTRTGALRLYGSSDRFIIQFAKKHNIRLRWLRKLNEIKNIEASEIFNLTVEGQVDIPTRPYAYSVKGLTPNVEYGFFIGFTQIFIVVPCGQEMSIGDVYTGLRTYASVVLAAYFMFAVTETLIVAATNWIFRRRPYLTYSPLLINLRALSGVLGLPMPLRRLRASVSLQQIVIVMSIFSLVLTSFFNANLSTLLTKHPKFEQIQNFKELRDSGLQVKIDRNIKSDIDNSIGEEFFKKLVPNTDYLSEREWRQLLFALNSTYAYQTVRFTWDILEKYQKTHKRNILCKSRGLNLTGDIAIGFILKKNSVYKWAFNDFVNWASNFGLTNYWQQSSHQKVVESIHPHISKNIPPNNEELKFIPLNMDDLTWLWKLLAVCYSVAGLVYIVEISVAHLQRKRARRAIIIRV